MNDSSQFINCFYTIHLVCKADNCVKITSLI